MDNTCQQIFYIIGLQVFLAIKYNLPEGDSFIVLQDILVFVPFNRKNVVH